MTLHDDTSKLISKVKQFIFHQKIIIQLEKIWGIDAQMVTTIKIFKLSSCSYIYLLDVFLNMLE